MEVAKDKGLYLFILFFIFFLLFIYLVLASQTYLNENTTWEQNLTGINHGFIVAGDINGNNKIDLIISGIDDLGTRISKVYTNNGSALVENITWGQNLTGAGYGSGSLGDVDNDGDLDFVLVGCASGGGSSVCSSYKSFVYINNGSTLIENYTWKGDIKLITGGGIALNDINNDGRLDLALVGLNDSGNIAEIYINNGTTFSFSNQWGQNLSGLQESGLAFGDVDNDGHMDLILAGDSGIKMTRTYLNNGSSLNSNSSWNQNLLDVDKPAITFGDYDNDGDLDLTYIGCCDYHRVYNNSGTTYSELQGDASVQALDMVGVFEGGVAFGDYNNDGYLDIIANGLEGHTTIYTNKNGSNFSGELEDPETDILNLEWSSLLWGDFDNDTDLDLTLAGWTPNYAYVKFYLSNRSLTRTNTAPTLPNVFQNYSLANGNIFLGWNNGSDNETISTGLYYNLRVSTISGGNDIVSGVFGGTAGGGWAGGGANGYFGNMMQRRNISLSGSRFSVGQTYYWSVQTIDTGLAKSAWSAENTFTLTSDFTPPVVALNAPSGVFNQTLNIVFNATVYDDYNLTNVSLYGNWSGWHINQTNSSGINNTDYIFKANLTEGEWLFGIRACDATSNCRGVNGTFRIDVTYPVVALVSPANGTSQTSSNAVTFTYNVTDIAINNCTLYLNGVSNETDTSITSNGTSQTFSENVPNGNYNWTVICADAANNINTTANYSLTISYTPAETPASTSSGGGGGGGSGGGGGAATTTPKVTRVAMIGEGLNQIAFTDAEKSSVGVEEILIESSARADYSKISVEKLTALPESIPAAPSPNTYSYLKIEKTILKDEEVKNAKITFAVSKKWVSDNDYNPEKVVLQRYTADWEKLPTNLLKQDTLNYYYQATTPGFSVFAITAEKKQEEKLVIEEQANKTEEVPAENPVEEAMPAPEQPRKSPIKPAYLAIIALASIAIFIIVRFRKTKRR